MSTSDSKADETWGVLRPDGTFVPMRGGTLATSREVAEAWEDRYPDYRAVPAPALLPCQTKTTEENR